MPARMLTEETLAEGFGEGSEDAKKEALYIDRIRMWLRPLYEFFEPIVMYRAWSPAFFATMQAQFPDIYGDVSYEEAFTAWRNSFKATWPSTLKEPESEKSKSDKVKLDSITGLLAALMPSMDPENKAILIGWAADNFNDLRSLFTSPLELDLEALEAYVPPEPEAGGEPPEKKGSR
jgi:hypothetical protein